MSPVYAIVAVAVGIVLTITDAPAAGLSLAVGPQYDTTHVYIAPEEFDRFSDALVATFGGTKSQAAVINITPTPQRGNVAVKAITASLLPAEAMDSRT